MVYVHIITFRVVRVYYVSSTKGKSIKNMNPQPSRVCVKHRVI